MIKTCIILIILLLYLDLGSRLFTAGIKTIGGKENYIEELREEHPDIDPNKLYFIALVVFVISWPAWIIRSTLKED